MAREGSETAAQREGSLWRAKPVVRFSSISEGLSTLFGHGKAYQ